MPKKLDLELLQRIRDVLPCNISLHGGSGTPGHYFVSAVKIGVTKININSDMRVAYHDTLLETLRDNPDEYAVAKLVNANVVRPSRKSWRASWKISTRPAKPSYNRTNGILRRYIQGSGIGRD
ncbi:MAG: class II fructose-bisphosphate aldolase [Candidatus Saccharibacteria bacterium]